MLKAVDRAMVIEGIRVVEKSGGRSGSWAAA
jgi:molybdenum cofactor biosynthesis enzyme